MPRRRREPAPFWWDARGCYYLQVGKKQIRLSPDEGEAKRLAHKILAELPEDRTPPAAAVNSPGPLVVELCDAFLQWAADNAAPPTYAAYKRRLQHLIDDLKRRGRALLPVSEFNKGHVADAVAAHPGWSPTTKSDFVGACQRVMNWARDEERIDRSPLAGAKKYGRRVRKLVVTPAQFAEVLAAIAEPTLRDLVELTWETGARVQEARKIEARHVDLDAARVVFPPDEAKGGRYHRVIYLGTGRAIEIVRRLCGEHAEGPILRNSEGTPWTKDAINCAFCRLEKKVGRKYHLGAFRKGFATEALKNGVDVVGLAHLMGHRDPSMIAKVYGRVEQDPEYMAALAEKAKRPRGGGASD